MLTPGASAADVAGGEDLDSLAAQVREEVESGRGMAVGQDLTVESMTIPEFAYMRYLEDREGRDEDFDNALRLFLFGWGADERNWTDPDVATIASARHVLGQYKPHESHIIITRNPSSLLSFVSDTLHVILANGNDLLKAYNFMEELLANEDRSRALATHHTLYHEMIHAAQDWNYGLAQWLDYFDAHNEIDLQLAVMALIEGDAEYSSAAQLCETMGLRDVLDKSLLEKSLKPEDRKTMSKTLLPPARNAKDPLGVFFSDFGSFPYAFGFIFTGFLHNSPDHDIDNAYRNIPVTTRQILHPDRDADGDFTLHVIDFGDIVNDYETYTLHALFEQGEIVVDTTLGEFGINSLLRAHGLFPMEEDAAEGWAGDRLRIYMNDDEIGVFFYTVWESRESAERFFSGYLRLLEQKCGFSTGRHLPEYAPYTDQDICGTQWLDIKDNHVMLFEIPARPEADEIQALAGVLYNAEIHTMPAREYLDWIGFYDGADQNTEERDEGGENVE